MKKVMFIDDDEMILRSMSRYFEGVDAEFFFERCISSEGAKSTVDRIRPDIVFLDHNLNKSMLGEGFEVMLYIREKYENCQVFSMASNKEDGEEYLEFKVEWIRKNEVKKIMETLKQII